MAIKPWKTVAVVNGKAVHLSVTIDWDRLTQKLAYGTLRNKSGKSRLLLGAIRARLIKTEAV